MSDEARELLERLVTFAGKNVDGLKVTNYDIYTSAGQQLIDDTLAFLAQPEPAAREAVLVEIAGGALECAANDLEALAEGVEFERGENAPWALVRRAIGRLYADLSPAAAALLAQGEKQRGALERAIQLGWGSGGMPPGCDKHKKADWSCVECLQILLAEIGDVARAALFLERP